MRFKTLVGIFLISAFLIALYISPYTKGFMKKTFGFLTGFLANLKFPSGPFMSTSQQMSRFRIEAYLSKNSIYGNEFEVRNSSIKLEGICIGNLKLAEGVVIQYGTERCEFEGYAREGRISVNELGTFSLDLKTESVKFNGKNYITPSMSFEVVPSSFSITSINARRLEMNGTEGRITQLKDGRKVEVNLYKEDILIDDFSGDLELKNLTLALKGSCSRIKFTTFEWR